MELSEALENYLKEIYELETIKGVAKVTDLILAFQVSPGTISKALDKLESLGLIDRSSRRLKLTDDGRKIAERLVKSHRLSERLLTDIIGIDWIRAHELAHRLEHIWPDDVLDRIDKILGYPLTCPHGHPIPGREIGKGKILSQVDEGKYKVMMIIKEEEWILRTMEEYGIKPGENILLKTKEKDKFIVEINGKVYELPKTLADQVMVYA
ncbi:MarR family transcriptional regulator [Acidianus sulfidivorans JP7]|uniref:DtxR family transcriptional regulator n=1 Tax=Acidianus sulfidivorans JP7 TaxID=619593 RepID=A0A2U9IM37_9CREN|nr:metal-dependent transcriptional regulator [Acidianus sulfidivorans]AWR97065.1 MarR family transcriptional regulator [Acidianus sulfidivorans JP7]